MAERRREEGEARRAAMSLKYEAGEVARATAARDTLTKVAFFFFFTLVTGPRRSLSLKLSDTEVCEPQIRARLGNHNTTRAAAARDTLTKVLLLYYSQA